ncbi:hypothetical protein A3D88_01095 [Candidatus Peribacteria bacterium RIFCSPHIGHO2_02_FULL_52_16]|nr:MAG: hypothetical protein A2706_05740 [Candidatus Peribacteria bacterium RIFCSPHIGHO2_01_FULL_51_35]OGJ61261.1 MAG: hypothetical protein A3D88_01095 [Candidatus Peribacteria bacterium RIFCSPHIGHO2_02_FULL_52_16]
MIRKQRPTKHDIAMLMDEVGKLYVANQKWKDEIISHFDVVAENMHHDLLGAHKDKIGVLSDRSDKHEKRIAKLEQHTELIAA